MSQPGPIALIGSGETAAAGGQAFEALASQFDMPLTVSVLETPAGFELNAASVAARASEFIQTRLQNFSPEVHQIPARGQHMPLSPNNPEILAPMLESQLFFAGAGSPTYAARQLQNSLAWGYLQARHRLGAALAFASAAAIAIGSLALPVYEIYKVGEDPHWKPGLDLLRPFGLSVAVIPHWNNNEGGNGLDTSHCFIGARRYEKLRAQLPPGTSVVGIDEHTSLLLDFSAGTCQVLGRGAVHLYCDGDECAYEAGRQFSLDALGEFSLPRERFKGIDPLASNVVLKSEQLRQAQYNQRGNAPQEVLRLVELRQAAREQRRWQDADRLRDQIAAMGWAVKDTPSGADLEPNP